MEPTRAEAGRAEERSSRGGTGAADPPSSDRAPATAGRSKLRAAAPSQRSSSKNVSREHRNPFHRLQTAADLCNEAVSVALGFNG